MRDKLGFTHRQHGLVILLSGLLLVFIVLAQLAPYKDELLSSTFTKGAIDASQRWLRETYGKKATLVIVGGLEQDQLNPVWNNIAQGWESDPLILEKGIELGKKLHPRLIRIDHVFDAYDLVKRRDQRIVMNFDQLDRVVKAIQAMGAMPFFSLSYMPTELSNDGSILGAPIDWREWQMIIKEFVEHYSGNSGLAIEGIYYEVWNEPDLFGTWKTEGSEKNYLLLYEHTALGAARATNVKPFYLGGPATTGLYPNWTNRLLDYSVEKNLKFDFISWHRYSQDVSDFIDDANWVRDRRLELGSTNLQFILSEWGPSAEMNEVYDTSIGAAHMVAVSRELYSGVDAMFAFELMDGKDPKGQDLWGRWGLLGSQMQPKPRYRAFQMLNKMQGTSLTVLGEGYWVRAMATKSGEVFQILVVNYDQWGAHSETVPVKITNISNGLYTAQFEFLNGGSRTDRSEVIDETWTYNLNLMPNEVVYIQLRKI